MHGDGSGLRAPGVMGSVGGGRLRASCRSSGPPSVPEEGRAQCCWLRTQSRPCGTLLGGLELEKLEAKGPPMWLGAVQAVR